MSYRCYMCEMRGQAWSGDKPKCAFMFDKLQFHPDNWNCATANAIRDIAEKNIVHCDDQKYSTIITEVSGALCLWVTWYKRRGRTEGMWLLFDDEPPRLPTEAELLEIIQEAESTASQ